MREIKDKMLSLVSEAGNSIPLDMKPDLQPNANTSGAPEWYGFEHNVWKLGEQIRSILSESKSLRKDEDIQNAIHKIAVNRKAKRGRQSFIMLLGNMHSAKFCSSIVEQLSDPLVCGHAIDTLTKMRCSGYSMQVEPFTKSEVAWIRNKAKRYMVKYGKS